MILMKKYQLLLPLKKLLRKAKKTKLIVLKMEKLRNNRKSLKNLGQAAFAVILRQKMSSLKSHKAINKKVSKMPLIKTLLKSKRKKPLLSK